MSRSKPRFRLCGLLQTVWILAFPVLMTYVVANGFAWVSTSVTLQDLYLRALVYGAATFAGGCALPVLVKWMLVGRWKPRQFRVWSLTYFRFWLVRTVIQLSPLTRFAGSPIFSIYLRLLGAKIGRGVVVLSPTVPACTDMLSVGAGTVIRKDALMSWESTSRGPSSARPGAACIRRSSCNCHLPRCWKNYCRPLRGMRGF